MTLPNSLRVTVHLHTTLRRLTPAGPLAQIELNLAPGATIADVLRVLEIALDPAALILVLNHHVVSESALLTSGDTLDLIPAISGG